MTTPGQDIDANQRARDIADVIRRVFNLAEPIVRRIALAAADGLISASELRRKIDYIATRKRAGTLRNADAYFVTCCMEEFRKNNIPWSIEEL